MRAASRLLAFGLAGLSVACTATDPLYDTSRWKPSGDNAANLVAQIVDPGDLQLGRHTDGGDGLQAAAAVARLRQDHAKKLIGGGLSQIGAAPGNGASDTAMPGVGGY